jgi:hypothetical protein
MVLAKRRDAGAAFLGTILKAPLNGSAISIDRDNAMVRNTNALHSGVMAFKV